MKNLIIIFAIFLSMSISYQFTYAQVTQEWIQRYNGPTNSSDGANSIAVDTSGNVYVTGFSTGSGTNYDYATIKYNSNGDSLWVQRYNGSGNGGDITRSIAVDRLGNVYVTGSSDGIGTGSDYATIKYNSSGVQQWVQRCNGSGNGGDIARSIAVDGSGNVYVTGTISDSVTGSDYATIKYSSSGFQQWVQRYNGPGDNSDEAYSIAIDGSGNVYVSGNSDGSNGTFSRSDYATIKYNSSGVQQWVQRYNGPGNSDDVALSIAVDSSGNNYVTGYSNSSGKYYRHDYATIKYNSSGIQQWVQRYDGPGNSGDEATSITIDGLGNVYVIGNSGGDYGTIKYNSSGVQQWVQRYNGPTTYNGSDFGNSIAVDGAGNVYVTGASIESGRLHYATIKYNSSGGQKWVQRYHGPGTGNDGASSMAVDKSGNVYVTGTSWGFENNEDYAIIKYSQPMATTLHLIALIEGFYDNVTNNMVRDTVKVYLRITNSPYSIVDSATSVLDSNGNGIINFLNNIYENYIVVKHRNSIETWSKQEILSASGQLSYDFTTAANKAYGDNLILKGSKFCIYSGDINQDGIVDLSDFSLVDNDAYNSVSGYVATDANGDNIVDTSDLSIVDNNSFNYVNMIRP